MIFVLNLRIVKINFKKYYFYSIRIGFLLYTEYAIKRKYWVCSVILILIKIIQCFFTQDLDKIVGNSTKS